MSDTAALGAWRRRAQGGGERRLRLPSTAAVGAIGIVLTITVLGRGVRHGERPRDVEKAEVPTCPAVMSRVHADVDGDGCDEDVTFADGTLTAGVVRMRVGAPGDQVALGRWTCGPVNVALLRPTTGEVFRFDGWASSTNTVPAMPLGRVEGAVGLRAAARGGNRCDDLVVTRSSGPPVLLPERPVAG